jgi:hypothetical protein
MKNKNFDSNKYWELRYQTTNIKPSGNGSYGKLAEFKSKVINNLISKFQINKIVEFGSGDGNQLGMFKGYQKYIGLDVSKTIVKKCQHVFKNDNTKEFIWLNPNLDINETCGGVDMILSLDVLFHLIEQDIYENYLNNIFTQNAKIVVIYGMNFDDNGNFGPHVKPRTFTKFISEKYPDYKLIDKINQEIKSHNHKKGSAADFFIYKKIH